MSKKIKTTHEEICEYWFSRIDESELSVDASEALERCWRCGSKSSLERCHIVPRSLGGEDIPSNFVLLCKRCHVENPNIADPEIMWDWLRAYKADFYDTFWSIRALEEHERIYQTKFEADILEFEEFVAPEEARAWIEEKIQNAVTHHFGHPYLNIATMAGLMRMLVKELKRKYSGDILES